ncbi:adaptin N terminal region-domain-containing protein [Pisolithus croceorrhizus]|nr:adaptin N terminal region-domain-containing protein [Pisolithus croceorrhizus]
MMDSVNLAALTENAARLGMRIQETLHEHTRDLSIARGGASLFDMPDDKNIGRQLEFGSDRERLEAMKRLIALTSRGRNMSNYFPQVVKNVASQDLEIRKLVYIYLLRYAEHEPDLALLSINAFQKDLTDPSPLIRAMALRVLSGIKVPMIGHIVVLAIKKCAADLSPHVRKAAALAIPKAYRLDSSQQPTLITIIQSLLQDHSALSIGSAVVAFESVCPTRLDLLHQQYRRLCRMLVDVDEWGQVNLLNLLLRYARTMLPKPTISPNVGSEAEEFDKDLQLLQSSAEPLFQSRNPAVVLAVVRVFYYTGSPSSFCKVINPLLRIQLNSRETERVVLPYISAIALEYPHLFSPHYAHFLICTNDPRQVKRDKIKVLLKLCTAENHQALLREFIDCADDPDDLVAGDAIHAVGQCAQRVPTCARQCISALLAMIKSRNDTITSNAIVVLKLLVQNQRHESPLERGSRSQDPLKIITQLAHRIDDIKHPRARACVIWLTGQYCPSGGGGTVIDGIADWAPDVLRKAVKSFIVEILTLAAKLLVLCPTDHTLELLCRYVFSLGKYDLNYEVRDRTRMLTSLLSGVLPSIDGPQPEHSIGEGVVLRREQVKKVLFEGKAGTANNTAPSGHDHLIGTLSLVIRKDMHSDSFLPEWLEAGIDPALRDNKDTSTPPAPRSISSLSASRPAGTTGITPVVLTPTNSTLTQNPRETWRDLDSFYASDSEQSEPESTSDEHGHEGGKENEDSDNDEDDEDEDGEESGSKSEEEEERSNSSQKADSLIHEHRQEVYNTGARTV